MKRFIYVACLAWMIVSSILFVRYVMKPDLIFVVPDHYHGWVTLHWDVPSEKPLKKYNGHFLVQGTGVIFTSTKAEESSGNVQIFWENEKGEWKQVYSFEGMKKQPPDLSELYFCQIDRGGMADEDQSISYSYFYIGTYEDCSRISRSAPVSSI